MTVREKAISLIDQLIDKLNNLPCCWEEFVGEELADEVTAFMVEQGEWDARELDE